MVRIEFHRVILGRSDAQTRESRDAQALVSEMLGSSPSMTPSNARNIVIGAR